MDISATASSAGTTSDASSRNDDTERPVISEDFRTFIDLLTVQVRNQDPTAPLESSQFVEQLATFSGLEQQANTNQKLDDLAGTLEQISLNTKSSREEVEDAKNTTYATFTGRSIGFDASPDPKAITTAATIKDEGGNVVRTLLLNNSADDSYQWDGKDNEGKTVANGLYSITITNLDTEGKRLSASAPALTS